MTTEHALAVRPSDTLSIRVCTRCRGEKAASLAFFAPARTKLGLSSQCRPCLNEIRVAFRRNHPETERPRSRNYSQQWRDLHPEEARTYARTYKARMRLEAMRHYSGGDPLCACCGITTLEFLSLDHINGKGRAHRAVIGSDLGSWLRRNGYPEGFRVLCHNCNMAMGLYGTCPHTKQKETEAA